MLDTLQAEDFSPLVGKPCRAIAEGDLAFDLTVESVEEQTRLKRPQDTRTPFSLVLKGPLEPSFDSGLFDMEWEEGPSLKGVALSRIVPPWGLDNGLAYYQMVFN